jgi:hypothetical protein
MKTFRLLIIIILTVLAFFTFPALGQNMEPHQENVQFIPMVPTEKSNVIAYIMIDSTDIYCKNYVIDHDLAGQELIFNIKTKSIPGGKCPGPIETTILLKQGIGQLSAGAYDVKLLVNGTDKASTKLYVTSGDIEVTATGRYADDQGYTHIVGDVRNTANYPIKLIFLDIGFIKNGQVVSHDQVYTTMSALMPQTSSGFDLLVNENTLKDAQYFASVKSYQNQTSSIKKGLQLIIQSTSIQSSGIGVVSGRVFNYAGTLADQVKVVCALYDESGTRTIDSIFDYTVPSSIKQEQSADFTIYSHHPITSQFTTSCNAESVQVAILSTQVVPEFPIVTLIFMASIVTLLIFKKSISFLNNA